MPQIAVVKFNISLLVGFRFCLSICQRCETAEPIFPHFVNFSAKLVFLSLFGKKVVEILRK